MTEENLSSYPTIIDMTEEEWRSFWEYLMHDYSIFDFVGKHGHDNVAQHLEWKRQDYFEWRINYDSYIDPPQTIRIPKNLLQGCHNCKWHEARAYRCLIGAGVECEWENDGTYDSSPTRKIGEEE